MAVPLVTLAWACQGDDADAAAGTDAAAPSPAVADAAAPHATPGPVVEPAATTDAGERDGGASPQAMDVDAAPMEPGLPEISLNADLPAPSMDCIERRPPFGECFTVSGEYNGQPFEGTCPPDLVIAHVPSDGTRRFGCTFDLGPDDPLVLSVTLGPGLFAELPQEFLEEPDADSTDGTSIGVTREARILRTHVSTEYVLAASHVLRAQLGGRTEAVPQLTGDGQSELATVIFATSVTPTAACVVDATTGLGCDQVRLRGEVQGRTQAYLAP